MKKGFILLLWITFSGYAMAQTDVLVITPNSSSITVKPWDANANTVTLNVVYSAYDPNANGGFGGNVNVNSLVTAFANTGTATGATTTTTLPTASAASNSIVVKIPANAAKNSSFTITITAKTPAGTPITGTATITVGSVLAIELVSFKAAVESDKVNLAWATASEKNNAFFEVERSYNGLHFETIGVLKGQGTTNLPTQYFFSDAAATGVIAYYRLKDVEFSGVMSHSKVLSVDLGKSAKLEIGTISVEGGLVTFNATADSDATFSVVNLGGQSVAHVKSIATKGGNIVQMPLSHLANGIYLMNLQTNNSAVTKKFIVTK
ncbi:MAG: hypothetical protein RLZZ628_475 [Bacteroidota bacterium]|jgi:hypothetical protein